MDDGSTLLVNIEERVVFREHLGTRRAVAG